MPSIRKKSFAAEQLARQKKKNPATIAVIVLAVVIAVGAVGYARDVLFDTLGKDNSVEINTQSMGGEDFSCFLGKIPWSFLLPGIGDRTALHNTSFDFNDKTISTGIGIMSEIAVRFVEKGLFHVT